VGMHLQEITFAIRPVIRRGISLILFLGCVPHSYGATSGRDQLQDGFDHLYNLSFEDAHRSFKGFEQSHPDDPRGPVFDAATYLFSEFDRLHILQSEFFLDDHNFVDRKQVTPDPEIKAKFDKDLQREDKISEARLRKSPNDVDALFANTMSLGLQADYLALIEKRNFQALSDIKDARETAQTLLSHDPKCYDAYLASGVENYLLSQKPAPVRWLLHLGGAHTDKDAGIANLRITAEKGHYLQPYAELLLAVAALRDGNNGEAKRLLSELADRFPKNTLYREELKKIS
jgi:hypothetical protein